MALLQKRPIMLRSLLIVATPYNLFSSRYTTCPSCLCIPYTYPCVEIYYTYTHVRTCTRECIGNTHTIYTYVIPRGLVFTSHFPPHFQLQMRGNCNIKKMAPKLQDSLMWYLVFKGAGLYITFSPAFSAGNAGKFTRTHTLPRKVREFQNTGECDITKMVPKLHCPPHFRLKMRGNVIYRPAP